MGLNVMIFDYAGYGDSSGKPTEFGTYIDSLAAWNYLVTNKNIEAQNVAIYGESLGGAVAAWLAEKAQPGALILDSTFTSAPDMGKKMFPFLPIRWLSKFKYDTLERIRRVGCPMLIAHSENDEMIPCAQGLRLLEAAKQPKQFHQDGGTAQRRRHPVRCKLSEDR